MIEFLVALFSLLFLILLHELSHFLVAKKVGVKVEEFGVGLPPKLISKKIGDTLYSLNLIPFGAFVRLKGEEKESKEKDSFFAQPLWKKMAIVLAGVFSFWIISFLIFSFLFFVGSETIAREENEIENSKITIVFVQPGSPAEKEGLRIGDKIKALKSVQCEREPCLIYPKKIEQVKEFVQNHKGKEIVLKIERGKKDLEIKIIPRIFHSQDEGPMGVVLALTTIEKYPFFEAILKGGERTFNETLTVIKGYYLAIKNLISGKPSGIEAKGPVGIFHLMSEVYQLGILYFLNFLASLSIYLAIFNALPIPALDGGKFLFLCLEGIRKKPISQKTEQKISAFFFTLLLLLLVLVTIKDIEKLIKTKFQK